MPAITVPKATTGKSTAHSRLRVLSLPLNKSTTALVANQVISVHLELALLLPVLWATTVHLLATVFCILSRSMLVKLEHGIHKLCNFTSPIAMTALLATTATKLL